MRKGKNRSESRKFDMKTLPFLVIVSILPLIVFCKITPITIEIVKSYLGLYDIDFFSYYKIIYMGIFALLSVVAIIFAFLGKDRSSYKDTTMYLLKPFSLLAVFVGLMLLSSLLSKYPKVSFWGFYGRYEGLVAYLIYAVIFVSGALLFRKKEDYEWLIKGLAFLTICTGVLGGFQFCGFDLFSSNFGRQLILSQALKDQGVQIHATLESGMVYGAFFHSNFLGSYVAMTSLLFSTLTLYPSSAKKRAGYAMLFAISFLLLLGSRSRAGMVGILVGLPFFLAVNYHVLKANLKKVVAIVLITAFMAVGMNAISGNKIFGKMTSLTLDPRLSNSVSEKILTVKVDAEGHEARIRTNKTELVLNVSRGNEITLEDSTGKELHMVKDLKTKEVLLDDNRYKNYKLYFGNTAYSRAVKVKIEDAEVFLGYENDKISFLDREKKPVNLIDPPKAGFTGYETFASSRGYIWSRTFPLLTKAMILGYGPDTFALIFPQNDYIGKLRFYGNSFIIVDKPHNMYLQIAMNSGVISLIVFIMLLIDYVVKTFKSFKLENEAMLYSRAFLVAVIAYCGAGFFNDSIVSVAPIFWAIFGIGFGITKCGQDKGELLRKRAEN